ncbi:MAG: DUF4293 family protein [Bacteroidota bacterium]
MIQRKQTLFLLQLIICGIALMYIPCLNITLTEKSIGLCLVPSMNVDIVSSIGHSSAIFLNLAGIVLSFAIIFLFKKREMQIKLSYLLIVLWLMLIAMIYFCPMVMPSDKIQNITRNTFAAFVGAIAILAAWFAIKFIKKDIELLKSADRIR